MPPKISTCGVHLIASVTSPWAHPTSLNTWSREAQMYHFKPSPLGHVAASYQSTEDVQVTLQAENFMWPFEHAASKVFSLPRWECQDSWWHHSRLACWHLDWTCVSMAPWGRQDDYYHRSKGNKEEPPNLRSGGYLIWPVLIWHRRPLVLLNVPPATASHNTHLGANKHPIRGLNIKAN